MINKSNRPFLAVRTIISDDHDRVLLIKRTNTEQGLGKWCLPGGNIEYDQSVSEAVIAEIKEETSLTCTNSEFLFYFENLPSMESKLHYVNLVFKCEVTGYLKLNNESSEYVWIDRGELQKYDLAFKNDMILKEFWQLK